MTMNKLMDAGSELALLRVAPVLTFDEDMVTLLLRGVRRVLEQYGWVARTYGDVNNGFCMAGAVHHLLNTDCGPQVQLVYERLVAVLPQRCANRPLRDAITSYNDNYIADKAAALAWVDSAIRGACAPVQAFFARPVFRNDYS